MQPAISDLSRRGRVRPGGLVTERRGIQARIQDIARAWPCTYQLAYERNSAATGASQTAAVKAALAEPDGDMFEDGVVRVDATAAGDPNEVSS
jgi:hypothetical protein